MIDLQMLGAIRLIASDGSEVGAVLRQPKRLALLAYLANPKPGTWHRRDMLLALFWPELDTAHARTSLRNALYVLRQHLGDEVVRNRGDEEVSVNPDALRTDVADVWDALRSARIDDAITRYGGDLLPGLFPADSDGFQRWLDSERASLKVAVSTAAMARIEEIERSGNAAHALSIARRVRDINGDDETIVRRIMTLHELIGDRAGGLSEFEAYRSRLASDFEAEPSPETIALANRLRAPTHSPPLRKRSVVPAKDSNSAASVAAFGAPTVVHHTTPARRGVRSIVAVLSLIAVGMMVSWKMTRVPLPSALGRSTPLTAEEGLQVHVSVAANGRLVAFAKGRPNDLRVYVQRVDGGVAWQLSADSLGTALMPRWAPDNDAIVFLAANHAYVSPTIGGSARIVARGGRGDAMIRSASWSPHGDSLAIVRNDSLLVVPQNGSGARLIGTGRQLHSCTWSPRSTWIACVSGNWIAFTPGPLFGNLAPSAVVLYPQSGGEPVDLTGNEFENSSPAWSANGEFLWFLSNREGVSGEAFAARIGRNGKPIGSFVRVGLNAESISMSTNRLAYSAPLKKANIWAVPIPRTGVVSIDAARQMTKGTQVVEVLSASRDGKWLVYDSDLRGNADIYRMSTAGGDAENLTHDLRPEFAAELSPDGSEFAWQKWVNGERHLFVKNIHSDSIVEVLPVRGDQGVPRWSPDGTALVAWSHDTERGAVFVVKRGADGKWLQPSWRLDFGQLPVWSPDGRTVAFVQLDGRVQTIPADSGDVTTLYVPKPGDPHATFIVWSREADNIWMLGEGAGGQGIWALSVRTGRPILVAKLDDPIGKSIGPGLAANDSTLYFPVNERSVNVRTAELRRR